MERKAYDTIHGIARTIANGIIVHAMHPECSFQLIDSIEMNGKIYFAEEPDLIPIHIMQMPSDVYEETDSWQFVQYLVNMRCGGYLKCIEFDETITDVDQATEYFEETILQVCNALQHTTADNHVVVYWKEK